MTLSKGMKELERFKTFYDNHNWYLPVNLVNFEIIATELCCLQIIKEKSVDMLLIKKYDNVSDYNSAVWLSGRDKLTDDEFKLLKEGGVVE